ncbi:MAG: alpha-galactosidase [Acidobacteria bacterium]|nr:alpha-galactosidase [Acidobacteriota bacterium]
MTINESSLNGHTVITARISATSSGPLERVVATTSLRTARFIEHGWQSWSTVRVTTPGDIRPERRDAPRWFRSQMLAERDGAGYELAGDTFLVFDGGVIGALSSRQQFTRFVVATDGSIHIEWLLDGRHVEQGDEVQLETIVVITGDPGESYAQYATLAGAEARPPYTPTPAWCSWYHYFGSITPGDIRENLTLAAAHGIDVVQIDDGWQKEIGVWTDVAPSWGEPLDAIAQEIRDAGCRAGIWTAPFLAIEGGSLALAHPEWLVRNDTGEPTTALFHGGWGGKIYALDTTRDDVLHHLEETYRHLRNQGFTYFKIDFLHAGAAVGHRFDRTQTRAQAFVRGLEAVRRGIGDDATLVGCGSPLLAAVGFVDIMRVSEDVAPYFYPREFFPGFPENTVSAQNALEASLLRAPLHQRWFTLDPDCVLLRTIETELSPHERDVVARGAAASSPFIVLSDRLSLYSPNDWDRAHQLWRTAPRGQRHLPRPLERPLQVRFDDETSCDIDIWSQPPTIDWDLGE